MKQSNAFKTLLLKLILCAFAFGAEVHAAGIEDVAPQKTAAQKEFAKLLSSGKHTEALMAWNSAFGNTKFEKTNTGIALHGYLLSKSGLPLFAAHWITSDTDLKKISAPLKAEVINLVATQAVNLPSKDAHKSWRQWIDDQSPLVVKNNKDLNWLKHRLNKTSKKDVSQRARLLWSMSVGAAKLNKAAEAERYIRELKGLDQDFIGEDKIEIQLARVLYQRNRLNEAIDSYTLIPKSSEFWLDAIEERAWAHLRLGNYDKARSDITTLLASTFKDYANAEAYVLAAITNLRICDYPRILEDSRKFKEWHIARIQEMESLADKGVNKEIINILNKMDETGADLSAAAGKLASLPRMALRSVDFVQPINTRTQLIKEIRRAQELKGRLEVMGGSQKLNQLVEWAGRQAQSLRTKSLRELKSLAAQEVKDYRVIVNKLKLAEVEVIHRMNVDESLQGKRGELGEVSQGRDVLVFPFVEEVWVDELDNYQARVKDCPTTKGASL